MSRSGFVALAGRPNVGKSTLVNAIVGSKVAIVSDKPQTTRRAIRGVATCPEWQLVLVDLPGVQRPRDPLAARMQQRVERGGVPGVIAVNKVDRLDRPRTVLALEAAAQLEVGDDVFPVSARRGQGVGPLVEHLVSLLPEGPFFFAPEERSDQPRDVLLAELIREQVLRRTFQEVPHS